MIGAGFFAHFHADGWQRIADAEISAVCDPIPGKASEFAEKYGIPNAYQSVEKMLDAESPDFVDIATRPDTHLPLTQIAASSGLDVICQKPMAPTIPDCVRMCEVCESAGVRLLVHENWRWQPWYRRAKQLLDEGVLGALQHISFDWRTGDGNGPEPFTAQPYFRDMPRLIIYESLVHILDTYRFLAGEMDIARCTTRQVNPAIVGDDWAEIDVTFQQGATGFIHGDRQSGPVPSPVAMGSMTLQGENGTLSITPAGHLVLDGTPLPFDPPTIGYKGDSVHATQIHLLNSLKNQTPCESEARQYLITTELVESCYAVAHSSQS
ncbi:MAG: Gfo/Idh/MocA family oxidoreductase [Verrucomicrobia bacterium]|nr:Gfo/Idh/MocA family oxidoreductase [Verrucomicrobiota bacterium]